MPDYHEMWAWLGLDLDAHDKLLSFLGQKYGEVFLTQKNRPAGMGYFDRFVSEVHGERIRELVEAKEHGHKIVGSYCVFVPEEIILACGCISVGLCSGADFATDAVERIVPRNTCALIKSALGFKIGKVCPYLELSDMVVGENTCDGKKKAYEVLAPMQKNLYVMDLPQMKTAAGKELLSTEYRRFLDAVQALAGVKVGAEQLRTAMKTVNAKRQSLMRLSKLRGALPAPISGLDALLITQCSFLDDPRRFAAAVNALCDELEERTKRNVGVFTDRTKRVVLSGCPMAIPSWKVPAIIETSGAVVVGEESCVGERNTRWMTNADGESVEAQVNNIVDRYFQVDCAVFTPNLSRVEHVKQMVQDYRAHGVIHYSLQFCQPYQIESFLAEQKLEDAGIAVLRIESDYSEEDVGQLRTRIEAFIERLECSVPA